MLYYAIMIFGLGVCFMCWRYYVKTQEARIRERREQIEVLERKVAEIKSQLLSNERTRRILLEVERIEHEERFRDQFVSQRDVDKGFTQIEEFLKDK